MCPNISSIVNSLRHPALADSMKWRFPGLDQGLDSLFNLHSIPGGAHLPEWPSCHGCREEANLSLWGKAFLMRMLGSIIWISKWIHYKKKFLIPESVSFLSHSKPTILLCCCQREVFASFPSPSLQLPVPKSSLAWCTKIATWFLYFSLHSNSSI